MMHASIDELLQIKDGYDMPMSSHVSACTYCQTVLNELKQTQETLQSFSTQVPQDAWKNIQREFEDRNKTNPNIRLTRAIYTLVATVLITGVGVIFMLSQHFNEENHKQHSMMQLIADSNALENMIAIQMTTNEVVMSQQASFSMDKTKWRLMLIDQKIQSLSSNDIDKKITLWQDRIRALKTISSRYYQFKNNNVNQQPL